MRVWLKNNWQILLISIIVAFLASVPYLYGYLFKKEGLVFLGRSVVNSADTYTHLSNIVSARNGSIVFPNLYTPESKTPFILRPTYIILGWVSKIFDLSPLTTLHISRFLLDILFVFILAKFIEIFFKEKRNILLALLVVSFSSGVGSLLYQFYPSSIDLWVPEANTFFMLLESPHFVATQIFMLLFILFIYKFISSLERRNLIYSSFFASIAMIEHPYMVPFIGIIALLFIFFLPKDLSMMKRIKCLIIFFIFPILSGGLIYKLYYMIEAAKLTLGQTYLPTPSVENVLYGYGILLPFALIGFYISDYKKRENLIIMIWILLTFILIYSPFPTQRRFLEGVHIPIAILSCIGLFHILEKFKRIYFRSMIFIIFFLLFSLSNIYNVLKMIETYSKDTKTNYNHYIDKDEMEGMVWLGKNTKDGQVVLANLFYSNIIPGVSGRFVYYGHGFLTYEPKKKLQIVDAFMKTTDQELRQKFLKKVGIDYLYFGKNDYYNKYRPTFEGKQYLKKIWNKNGVVIYSVVNN